MTGAANEKILIRFDGVCVLCSSTVRLLLRLDRKEKFKFQAVLEHSESQTMPSVEVIQGDVIYRCSDAFFKIARELGGIYRIFLIGLIIPQKWRDQIYRWIARHRYSWFGKNRSCFVPGLKDASRFI